MPQGSWLRQLTFLVLIDNLNVDCLLHKYVDDTTLTELLLNNGEPSNMQSYLQQLLNWADSNNMVVNFDKTKEMIMGPISKTSNFLPLTTDTGFIEQVNSFKLLGLHLDSNFSWSTHVETILSKATQRVYFLKQLKWAGVPYAQLLHFYLVVIRPVGICGSSLAPPDHQNTDRTDRDSSKESHQNHLQLYLWHAVQYTNALYIAQISSLADRREQLSRVFFNSILRPSLCYLTICV